MDKLADIITDRRGAGVIVALVLLLAAASLLLAGSVEQEDDLLAFLPQDNPDIALFQDINQRFGGLDVAMVGIDVEDAYAPESIARLRDATAALQARPNLDHVLSLANVDDFTPDPLGGIRIGKLVESVPETPEDTARLRALVGYGTYRGLIGHVDQQDPAVLVDPDVETDMVWRRIGS